MSPPQRDGLLGLVAGFMGMFTGSVQWIVSVSWFSTSVGRIFQLNVICGILFFDAYGLAVFSLDALLAAIGLVIVNGGVGCSG